MERVSVMTQDEFDAHKSQQIAMLWEWAAEKGLTTKRSVEEQRFIDERNQLLATCESVAERAFFEQLVCCNNTWAKRPVPQFRIGRYRLDFAFPAIKLAVEIDGIEFHGSQFAFIRDRKRTRFLESKGWRIMRFAAKEVLEVGSCKSCAAEVWSTVAQMEVNGVEVASR